MCGIIGIVSNKLVASNIIKSLKKLEYRGYDSSGIATILNNEIIEKKCTGSVDNLEKLLFNNPSNGSIGVGTLGGLLTEFQIKLMLTHILPKKFLLCIMV